MLSFNMKYYWARSIFLMYMYGIPCYPEWWYSLLFWMMALGVMIKRKRYILYVDDITYMENLTGLQKEYFNVGNVLFDRNCLTDGTIFIQIPTSIRSFKQNWYRRKKSVVNIMIFREIWHNVTVHFQHPGAVFCPATVAANRWHCERISAKWGIVSLIDRALPIKKRREDQMTEKLSAEK